MFTIERGSSPVREVLLLQLGYSAQSVLEQKDLLRKYLEQFETAKRFTNDFHVSQQHLLGRMLEII